MNTKLRLQAKNNSKQRKRWMALSCSKKIPCIITWKNCDFYKGDFY